MLAAAMPALAVDSLCMSTVDVYEFDNIRSVYGAFGNYIFVQTTGRDSITVLSVSDSGQLSYEGTIFDGLFMPELYKINDTLGAAILGDSLRLINFSNPLAPVIIDNFGSMTHLEAGNSDFVCRYGSDRTLNFYDLRSGDTIAYWGSSPVISVGDSAGIFGCFYVDYPYLITGGSRHHGHEPDFEWDGLFGIINFENPDSIYLADTFSVVSSMDFTYTTVTKLDSILIFGDTENGIDLWLCNNDYSSCSYITTITVPGHVRQLSTYDGYLYSSGYQGIDIYSLNEFLDAERVAYYDCDSFTYHNFCCIDSYLVVLTRGGTPSVIYCSLLS